LNEWANDWVKYHTDGKGNYVTTAMEDNGTLQSLTWLARADAWMSIACWSCARPAISTTASWSFRGRESGRQQIGKYTGYISSLESLGVWECGGSGVGEELGQVSRCHAAVTEKTAQAEACATLPLQHKWRRDHFTSTLELYLACTRPASRTSQLSSLRQEVRRLLPHNEHAFHGVHGMRVLETS